MAKLDGNKDYAGQVITKQKGQKYSGGSSYEPAQTIGGGLRSEDVKGFEIKQRAVGLGVTGHYITVKLRDGRSTTMSVEDFRTLTKGKYDYNLSNIGII